jgi:DNA-binding winged helix-turn-helix (wHTH) protein/tetratricopeptide (TPR) repeat protein
MCLSCCCQLLPSEFFGIIGGLKNMGINKEKFKLDKQSSSNQIYKFDNFIIDTKLRRLFHDGDVIQLTSKLFDVLLLLVSESPEIVTKEELMNEVWANQFVEENNLAVNIWALRKILGETYSDRKYIETVPKRGYRFTAKVKLIEGDDASDYDQNIQLAGSDEMSNSLETISSLAVIPFITKSNDNDLDYIADGLTESTIASLSLLPHVKVIAHSIITRYTGQDLDVRDLGQKLNVQAVVMGRIIRNGENLSISVELISTKDCSYICAKNYNIPFDRILDLQEAMASEINKGLDKNPPTKSNPNHLSFKRYTINSEAHRLYLKGRYFLKLKNPAGIEKACECFNRAIEIDRNYSLAYSGLADCYSAQVIYGLYSPQEVIPKAKRAVIRALELEETLAEAHASLAKIKVNFDWDWSGAQKEYRRAIELNPRYATAYQWYAEHSARTGAFNKALDLIDRAMEIEGLSIPIIKSKAMIFYQARQFKEAEEQCREALEMNSDLAVTGLLGYIFTAQQKYEEAAAELQKLISFASGERENSAKQLFNFFSIPLNEIYFSQSEPEAIGALGYILARLGMRNEALALASKLIEFQKQRYFDRYVTAIIYIGLEDYEQAFEWLEKSFSDRAFILTLLKTWHFFDPLRTEPRFKDLYERVGFGC